MLCARQVIGESGGSGAGCILNMQVVAYIILISFHNNLRNEYDYHHFRDETNGDSETLSDLLGTESQ